MNLFEWIIFVHINQNTITINMIYIIYISTFKRDTRNDPAGVFTRYGEVNGGSFKNSQIKAKHSTWAEFGADELTDFSAGERGACQWCWVFAGMGSSLKRFFHA